MGGSDGVIREGDLVVGRSYTLIVPAKTYIGFSKTFFGKYDGIVKNHPFTTNIYQPIGVPTDVHSFPEIPRDATKHFPIGYFNEHNLIFEEGDTTKQRGGRRRKNRARKTRRNNRLSRRNTRRQ